jgi:outer membrane protein OmpA-like peptidoglycan-associated protein
LLVAALGVGTAAAQNNPAGGQTPPGATTQTTRSTATTQDEIVLTGDTTPRPAIPTVLGDTGLWFVPTAETLPKGRISASVNRANFDLTQGRTDVGQFGITGAVGLGSAFELFGTWGIVRLHRDVTPIFVPSDQNVGGISYQYPYVRQRWSKNVGGPLTVGGKVNFISQSRGDAMGLALRGALEFPIGPKMSGNGEINGRADLVASKEFSKKVELTGSFGAILRKNPAEFKVPDSAAWGVGMSFPSRSVVRGLVEWSGEFAKRDYVQIYNPPYIADDGSVAPIISTVKDPTDFRAGVVFGKNFFGHAGISYSSNAGDTTVGGIAINHNPWGFEASLGWHPGVTPARERQHIIKETTTVTNTVTLPVPPAPAANRPPVFNVNATCDPCVVEVGGTSRLSASATDPEGGPVTYAWTAAQGTINPNNAANTTFTAPGQPGNVLATVTATDNRGLTATSSTTLQVVQREVITFEDVHFDFDRYNLRRDALAILDDAVAKLQRNPNVRITIEGYCDSIGTEEYNLALGERRATSVRDYLTSRGITANRMRTISYGEGMPIGDNRTAPGRAMNRRAHLVVIIETVQ